jgi:hypothetical protein
MDTLRVFLHLTGLLLITPDSGNHHATHVLIPEPGRGIEQHVTRLFYRTTDGTGCGPHADICIMDLDSLSLVIGEQVKRAGEAELPDETPNVSTTSSRRVPRDRYGRNPSRRLRARAQFWVRQPLTTCAKAWWEFRGTAMRIPNVVSYELVHTGDSLPRISVSTLRSLKGVASQTTTLSAVPEPGTREIHLFLYSVPTREAQRIERLGAALFAATLSNKAARVANAASPPVEAHLREQEADTRAHFDDRPPYRSRAGHYRAYYNLIGARLWNRRTQPRFLMPILDEDDKPVACRFDTPVSELTKRAVGILSAGSYSCLVAAGTPVQ